MAIYLAALSIASWTVSERLEAQIQQFSSGSNGSDGALNIIAPGVTYLDPKAMNLNPAGDNIFNFTTITIAAGSILKLSEARLHGPVYFLAQGDVVITGVIDASGDASPGPTSSAAEQGVSFAGSGGYSGGLGGIHGDSNHQALPGNGPGGGLPGDESDQSLWATGGSFATNRFLVPLVGGSGGGGTNASGQYGSQGGGGGGALLIASSTTIKVDSSNPPAAILARGGDGGDHGCGGSGGAVRLVANSIVGAGVYANIYVDANANVRKCRVAPTTGLIRLESNNTSWRAEQLVGPVLYSVPFALNLPTVLLPVITVSSINGIPVNANPFSFPDATINSSTGVPVVINATNVPTASQVTLYLLSDVQPNQTIPVTLTGTTASSTVTVQVTFPPGGSRGFVKAVFK